MTDPSLAAFQERASQQDPYFQFTKIQVEELQPGETHFSLFIEDGFHTNRLGMAHGAVLSTMTDASMGWAARTLGYHVVTLNIEVTFVRPAKAGTRIYSHGKIVHHGTRTLVGETHFYDEEGHLLLLGRGTYCIVKEIDLATEI